MRVSLLALYEFTYYVPSASNTNIIVCNGRRSGTVSLSGGQEGSDGILLLNVAA